MHLFLCGFKNSGKSTLGKLLADHLGKCFLDTDSLLEKAYCKKYHEKLNSSQIYEKKGEAFFRDLEKEVIEGLSEYEDCVVALGGGSILEKDNVETLKKMGSFIYLNAPKEQLKKRCFRATPPVMFHRCGMDPLSCFESHYAFRKPIYEKIADLQVILSGNLEQECKDLFEAVQVFLTNGK